MANLKQCFASKLTENGDQSYNTTGNTLLDVLFMTEYFRNHINSVPSIGTDDKAKLFAMFIRDGRFGIGCRDLGRELMKSAGCTLEDVLTAGRADDVWQMYHNDTKMFHAALDYLKAEIEKGNELVKKWMPRYASKNLEVAREIAAYWFPELPVKGGARKRAYGKFIKACSTVEHKLSRKADDSINFEHVPSLAAIKYAHAFATKETMKDRYAAYKEAVKTGDAKLHVATSTPYDIYKNRNVEGFDADMFFDQLDKIDINAICVVDSSGSMQNGADSYGKALAIGHYIAKNSSYMPNHVVSFSSRPTLLELGKENEFVMGHMGCKRIQHLTATTSYCREIESMHTGDCSNTDFGAVMRLLQGLDKDNAPEWIVVLSDMEFDAGSNTSLEETMRMFHDNGFNTKIVWWNLNAYNKTVPQMMEDGCVYLSGYSPMLLKYLEAGFNGEQFLDKLLGEYSRNLVEKLG